MKLEVTFTYEKETKGTFRFKEDGNAGVVGTLYVRKTAMSEAPDKLKVTIEDVPAQKK